VNEPSRQPPHRLIVFSLAFVLVVCVAGLPGFLAASPPEEVSGRVLRAPGRAAPGSFDPLEAARRMAALQARLAAERVEEADPTPIIVRVTAEELQEVRQPSRVEQRLRVGVAKHAGVTVDFADLRPAGQTFGVGVRPVGAIRRSDDGGLVWTGRVESAGAAGLRIRLEEFLLPAGAERYFYNLEGEAYGPYAASGPGSAGDFWTHTVSGDRAYLQLEFAGPADMRDLRAIRFVVSEVGHLDPVALGIVAAPQALPTGFCGYNAYCVVNGECAGTGDWAPIVEVRNGVAHLLFASGAWLYICSGGLLNDVAESGTPYFLTANHCINKAREASSLEAYFQYRALDCGDTSTCSPWPPASPRTLGSTIVSANKTSDYTLLMLSQAAPAGSYFLGWNATAVAFANGTPLYRLSHPKGAPQAYSRHEVDTSKVTCTSWPRGSWIYSTDRVGATEGGSSGSPILDAAGEVVGQLSGACGYNVNDVCDSILNATVDGAFAAYYSQVEPYLGTKAENRSPVASFTYGCIGLTCDFDGSASSDPDGSIAGYTWYFGDGGTGSGVTAIHTYPAVGPYSVTLTVTDDEGATGSQTQTVNVTDPPGGIVLTATGYKFRGLQKVDLSWTGASSVIVYRDGSPIASANGSTYTDNLDTRGPGSYPYQVCNQGHSNCSNVVTVSF
jgi:hypothetical protein